MFEVARKGYPQDVTDEEWAFVLPYLLLSREDSRSRKHSLRELFNGVRYIVRTGNQWRCMPNDLPPWPAVYQQMRRWMEAGVFEILVADVQALLRHFGHAGRSARVTDPPRDGFCQHRSTPSAASRSVRTQRVLRGEACHQAERTFQAGVGTRERTLIGVERAVLIPAGDAGFLPGTPLPPFHLAWAWFGMLPAFSVPNQTDAAAFTDLALRFVHALQYATGWSFTPQFLSWTYFTRPAPSSEQASLGAAGVGNIIHQLT